MFNVNGNGGTASPGASDIFEQEVPNFPLVSASDDRAAIFEFHCLERSTRQSGMVVDLLIEHGWLAILERLGSRFWGHLLNEQFGQDRESSIVC